MASSASWREDSVSPYPTTILETVRRMHKVHSPPLFSIWIFAFTGDGYWGIGSLYSQFWKIRNPDNKLLLIKAYVMLSAHLSIMKLSHVTNINCFIECCKCYTEEPLWFLLGRTLEPSSLVLSCRWVSRWPWDRSLRYQPQLGSRFLTHLDLHLTGGFWANVQTWGFQDAVDCHCC